MNAKLESLISKSRKAQQRAVIMLREDLKIEMPKSNRDWLAVCERHGLHRTRELKGIPIYVNGYGIELTIDGTNIDFDWGDNCEGNGFDAWRQWNHNELNILHLRCTYQDIQAWLEEAFASHELRRDRLLYYRACEDYDAQPPLSGYGFASPET